MSQSNENQTQANETQDQTEFALEVSKGKARLELTISSEQAQKLLRAAGLLVSHLLAASLGSSINLDPSLVQHPAHEVPPMAAPAPARTADVQR